jgi:hypothetical protein
MKLSLLVLPMMIASVAGVAVPGSPLIVKPSDVIALEAGIWDAEITTPAHKAGGAPTTTKELRSGGLWMLNRMSVNGGAYEGTGVWGFDPKTGGYSGAWVDNGTGRIRMDRGSWNPQSRTMTWTSEIDRADGKKVQMRATSTFSGQTRTYRAYLITDAGEVPLSTVVFTRRPD